MQKTKIEWCDYTWNPITGCRRGCKYCYARRIHDRFNKYPFSEIVFHPFRMDDLLSLGIKKPSIIFVGSMSDIEYWNKDDIDTILKEVSFYHYHTFMFLTKNPYSYYGFYWPRNTMQGLTMELTQTQDCQSLYSRIMLDMPRPYLSIEPLMGTLKIEIKGFEKIIVGAMTGPGAIKPKSEWIQSIIKNTDKEKVFWKQNIKIN